MWSTCGSWGKGDPRNSFSTSLRFFPDFEIPLLSQILIFPDFEIPGFGFSWISSFPGLSFVDFEFTRFWISWIMGFQFSPAKPVITNSRNLRKPVIPRKPVKYRKPDLPIIHYYQLLLNKDSIADGPECGFTTLFILHRPRGGSVVISWTLGIHLAQS